MHILIVDDDALLRRSLPFNLEKARHRANTAAMAEDALARVPIDHQRCLTPECGLYRAIHCESYQRRQQVRRYHDGQASFHHDHQVATTALASRPHF